jgi:hypothetical protein
MESSAVCEQRSSAELHRSLRQHAAQSTFTKSPGSETRIEEQFQTRVAQGAEQAVQPPLRAGCGEKTRRVAMGG